MFQGNGGLHEYMGFEGAEPERMSAAAMKVIIDFYNKTRQFKLILKGLDKEVGRLANKQTNQDKPR